MELCTSYLKRVEVLGHATNKLLEMRAGSGAGSTRTETSQEMKSETSVVQLQCDQEHK
jgi:hypothetical protein